MILSHHIPSYPMVRFWCSMDYPSPLRPGSCRHHRHLLHHRPGWAGYAILRKGKGVRCGFSGYGIHMGVKIIKMPT